MSESAIVPGGYDGYGYDVHDGISTVPVADVH